MKPVYADEVEANYNVTELSNGFTVLTESQTFPSAVNMGKLLFLSRSSSRSKEIFVADSFQLNYNSLGNERKY